jgi:hypothetical protein
MIKDGVVYRDKPFQITYPLVYTFIMQDWLDPYYSFNITGRITKVGLYRNYILKAMREEMAHISNNMIINTLHLPENIKDPVKEAFEYFGQLDIDVQLGICCGIMTLLLYLALLLLRRCCRVFRKIKPTDEKKKN